MKVLQSNQKHHFLIDHFSQPLANSSGFVEKNRLNGSRKEELYDCKSNCLLQGKRGQA